MKKLFYISVLILLVFSSCRSKRNMVSYMPQQVMQADTALLADTVGLPASLSQLLTFDQTDLRNVRRRPAKKRPAKKKVEATTQPHHIVQRGTKIAVKTIDVPSSYKGVSRIRQYDFTHRDVPAAFDGCRIAFVSDIHYKSLLKEQGLKDLSRLLIDQKVDALLLGGDFHEGCQYVPPVMAAMGRVNPPLGIYAVLGNNDYDACYDDIVREMERNNIHLLEHKVDTLKRGGSQILVAGVRNPFRLKENGKSPTLGLSPDDFVILLVHTPDYAEDVPVTNSDLVLAGHTHGGQMTLFGRYAPVINSHYGQRFVSGLAYNSKHIPVITTNGIGTSKVAIRMFAPSEIMIIVLHQLKD
ncbi:MAG: metallophosphoesterase [Bacteroides sp.]|nr:metallophosphoesterase [Bacteroides sp.]